jgi:hypothetical protein
MKNFKIKNSIGFFTLVVLLMMGCKEKPVEKEVIVMPGSTTETTTKESTKIIEKETPSADSTTSVTLDKNGLKVEAEKVDVKIGN